MILIDPQTYYATRPGEIRAFSFALCPSALAGTMAQATTDLDATLFMFNVRENLISAPLRGGT